MVAMHDGLEARGGPDTTDAVIDAVGPRLRTLRTRRNTTLAELSSRTGISVSTLSRLESGQRRPTLELLLPLARAHRVALDDLVGAPQTGDPRVHMRPRSHHGLTIIPLTRRTDGMRSFKQLFPPHWPGGDPAPQTHEGHEWMYVLSGRLRLVLGDQEFDLATGEVVEFDTQTPHWIANESDEVVEVLCLYGPQGERAHVRATGR
jgi:transcriptional regulator with XRE-family HTH domain